MQVAKPDVVITSYDVVASDVAVLRTLPWELIVLDQRGMPRGATAKAQAALAELRARQRLLLLGADLPEDAASLMPLVALVMPDRQVHSQRRRVSVDCMRVRVNCSIASAC